MPADLEAAIAAVRQAIELREDMTRSYRRAELHYGTFAEHKEQAIAHAAALRDAVALLEGLRWRPIAEYPRDAEGWGANALLFVPTGRIAPASDYRIVTGRLEAGVWLHWSVDGLMGDVEGEPTDWMRLPPAPEGER